MWQRQVTEPVGRRMSCHPHSRDPRPVSHVREPMPGALSRPQRHHQNPPEETVEYSVSTCRLVLAVVLMASIGSPAIAAPADNMVPQAVEPASTSPARPGPPPVPVSLVSMSPRTSGLTAPTVGTGCRSSPAIPMRRQLRPRPLTAGTYRIGFADYTGNYLEEFWNDQPDVKSATGHRRRVPTARRRQGRGARPRRAHHRPPHHRGRHPTRRTSRSRPTSSATGTGGTVTGYDHRRRATTTSAASRPAPTGSGSGTRAATTSRVLERPTRRRVGHGHRRRCQRHRRRQGRGARPRRAHHRPPHQTAGTPLAEHLGSRPTSSTTGTGAVSTGTLHQQRGQLQPRRPQGRHLPDRVPGHQRQLPRRVLERPTQRQVGHRHRRRAPATPSPARTRSSPPPRTSPVKRHQRCRHPLAEHLGPGLPAAQRVLGPRLGHAATNGNTTSAASRPGPTGSGSRTAGQLPRGVLERPTRRRVGHRHRRRCRRHRQPARTPYSRPPSHITGQLTNAAGTALAEHLGLRPTSCIDGDWSYVRARRPTPTATTTSGASRPGPTGSGSANSNGNYLEEFWNDQPDVESASDIVLGRRSTVAGKNAVLAPASHITGKALQRGRHPAANIWVWATSSRRVLGLRLGQVDGRQRRLQRRGPQGRDVRSGSRTPPATTWRVLERPTRRRVGLRHRRRRQCHRRRQGCSPRPRPPTSPAGSPTPLGSAWVTSTSRPTRRKVDGWTGGGSGTTPTRTVTTTSAASWPGPTGSGSGLSGKYVQEFWNDKPDVGSATDIAVGPTTPSLARTRSWPRPPISPATSPTARELA